MSVDLTEKLLLPRMISPRIREYSSRCSTNHRVWEGQRSQELNMPQTYSIIITYAASEFMNRAIFREVGLFLRVALYEWDVLLWQGSGNLHTHTHTCVIFSKKLNIRNRLCTSFSNNCRRRGNRSNGWDFSPSRTALYSGSREWMWRIRRRQERTTVYSLRAMLRLAWWKRAWRVWTVSTCISTTIIYAYVCKIRI